MYMQASADDKTTTAKHKINPVWLYITMLILAIPLAVAVYWSMSNRTSGIVVARPDSSCNLQQGPCQAVFPNGGKVTLSISPHPVYERKQLHLRVWLKGIKAKSVYVNFLGQNMYMGYNRPKLKQVAPGEFAGTWALASCGLFVEHMEWQTMVLIRTANQRIAAKFPLETQPITGNNT